MQHIEPQVSPNQKGQGEHGTGKREGRRGTENGWLATPMARYKGGRDGGGEGWVGRSPMCSRHHAPDEYMYHQGRREGEGTFADLKLRSPTATTGGSHLGRIYPHYLSGLGTGIECGWLATPDG